MKQLKNKINEKVRDNHGVVCFRHSVEVGRFDVVCVRHDEIENADGTTFELDELTEDELCYLLFEIETEIEADNKEFAKCYGENY